jgi:hypothetical protein
MRRREFIAGLGSAAAWPVVALGQQSAVPDIGWLSSRNGETDGARSSVTRVHWGSRSPRFRDRGGQMQK